MKNEYVTERIKKPKVASLRKKKKAEKPFWGQWDWPMEIKKQKK